MQLVWSPFARADPDQIFDYIEADNPRAAIAVDERIQTQVERLLRFPEIGRPGRIAGTRELVVSHTPYIAVYRIAGNTISILRVLHARNSGRMRCRRDALSVGQPLLFEKR